MCDFVTNKLQNGKTDKEIVEELLDSILAPDTSSPLFFSFYNLIKLFPFFIVYFFLGGMGCDNMTCVLVFLKIGK